MHIASAMTLADLLRPFKAKQADTALQRLLDAADSGRTGVDLSKMGDAEIIRRLSRRP